MFGQKQGQKSSIIDVKIRSVMGSERKAFWLLFVTTYQRQQLTTFYVKISRQKAYRFDPFIDRILTSVIDDLLTT